MSSETARHALTMNILRIAQLQASLTYERSLHLALGGGSTFDIQSAQAWGAGVGW